MLVCPHPSVCHAVFSFPLQTATSPLITQLKSTECTTKLVSYCCSDDDKTCRYSLNVMTALLELLREEKDSQSPGEQVDIPCGRTQLSPGIDSDLPCALR